MKENPDELKAKIEKLPNWAQSHIRKLEQDREYYKKQIADMAGEDSPIWHSPDYQVKLHLPRRTTVVFKLEGGELEFDLREGMVLCRANGVGQAYPFIMPDATNCFTIGMQER